MEHDKIIAQRLANPLDKDRESSGRKDEEIEMEKQLVTNDEHKEDELQEEEEEEVAVDDYFQDPTDIFKYYLLGKTCLHTTISLSSLSQCLSLTQYPLKGSQSM